MADAGWYCSYRPREPGVVSSTTSATWSRHLAIPWPHPPAGRDPRRLRRSARAANTSECSIISLARPGRSARRIALQTSRRCRSDRPCCWWPRA